MILKGYYMKKKIVISLVVLIVLIVVLPYMVVECNTVFWGANFENEYKQTNIISKIEYYKVFYCTGNKAKVYYVEEKHNSGNYIWFHKVNSKWEMEDWRTVWSKYGSASGITYPIYK